MGTVHKDSKARDTLFPAGDLEQLPGQLQPALGETVQQPQPMSLEPFCTVFSTVQGRRAEGCVLKPQDLPVWSGVERKRASIRASGRKGQGAWVGKIMVCWGDSLWFAMAEDEVGGSQATRPTS